MKWLTLVAAMVLVCSSALADISVVYDQSTAQLSCAGKTTSDVVCTVEAGDGDLISVQGVISVPGVLDMAIQKVDQPQEAAPAAFVTAAGSSAAQTPAANSAAPNQTIHGTP